MGRPYGKTPRSRRAAHKGPKDADKSLRIRLCREDGLPMTLPEAGECFFEVLRKLMSDPRCHRVTRAMIYVSMIDQADAQYLPAPGGDWEIRPYSSAADEHGL